MENIELLTIFKVSCRIYIDYTSDRLCVFINQSIDIGVFFGIFHLYLFCIVTPKWINEYELSAFH